MNFQLLVEEIINESSGRCTKATKQMSSTRKDKKYMKCVKVDGKLKRVHYGDPIFELKNLIQRKEKPSELVINALPLNLVLLNG